MRLLRKILLKLTVVVVCVIIIYCLLTNGVYSSINNFGVQNIIWKANRPSTLAVKNRSTDYFIFQTNLKSNNSLEMEKKEYYNVWCIFTKVTTNSPMRRKFKIFTESLLRLSSVDVIFHLITDRRSRNIADEVILIVEAKTKKNIQVGMF